MRASHVSFRAIGLLCRHAQSDGTTLWVEYSSRALIRFPLRKFGRPFSLMIKTILP